LIFELNFSELAIKGRQSMGNILTRHQVHRIVLKESGVSTLGGLKIWFDDVVFRLNTDERGQYLGEFKGNDKILVVTKDGQYHMTNFDISNHYPDDILRIEKYKGGKVFSAVYYDGEQEFYYLKRFEFEDTNKYTSFIGEHKDSRLLLLTDERWPQVRLTFGGKNEGRPEDVIDVDEFIAVKSYKARGKRLSTLDIKKVVEIEPLQKEVPEPEPELEPEDTGLDDMVDETDTDLPDGDGEQMSLGFD
jgi:topoisomerase-4 subunit A